MANDTISGDKVTPSLDETSMSTRHAPASDTNTTRTLSAGRHGHQSNRAILENLPTGSRVSSTDALARSRNVRRLRLILPAITFILIAAFLITTTQAPPSENTRLDDLTLDEVSAAIGATEARYAGLDKNGEPYEVTAAQASQDPDRPDFINLNVPRATLRDGEATTLTTAEKGFYQRETQMLELSDNVILEREIQGQTFTLRAPSALVSINDEIVTSDSGVKGEAESGRLRADKMKVYNEERRMVLQGNVVMKFTPNRIKSTKTKLEKNKKNPPKPNDQ